MSRHRWLVSLALLLMPSVLLLSGGCRYGTFRGVSTELGDFELKRTGTICRMRAQTDRVFQEWFNADEPDVIVRVFGGRGEPTALRPDPPFHSWVEVVRVDGKVRPKLVLTPDSCQRFELTGVDPFRYENAVELRLDCTTPGGGRITGATRTAPDRTSFCYVAP
jgi:hypothetical protein